MIQINGAPWSNEGCGSAYQFVRAALRKGHEIILVFFYHDGAYNGLRMIPPQDEQTLTQRWSILAAEYGIDLVVCISAAHRRGLLEEEAGRAGPAEGFRIAGLGLWVDACLRADRFLSFGG